MGYFIKHYSFFIALIISSLTLAQTKAKDYIIEGNKYYSNGNFNAAEYAYKKAALEDPTSVKANYNLGNALFQQKRYKESLTHFKRSAEIAKTKPEKHAAYHNAGNVYLEEQDYANAIESYKNALKNNPYDESTRYNLAYAKKMLEKQQEKNKQQNNSSNQKDQKNDKENKEKQNQQKNQNKENQQQQNNQNNQKQENSADKNNRENTDGNPKSGGQNGNQNGHGNQKNSDIENGSKGNNEQQNAPSSIGEGMLKALKEQEARTQRKIIQQKTDKQRTQTSKDW